MCEMERKGLGIRIGAYAIDVAIMIVVSMVLMPVMIFVPILGAILLLALAVGYPAIEVLRGQSPGKMILGLKVAGENGEPATQEQLIKRTAIKFSPSILNLVLSALNGVVGLGFILSSLGSVGVFALGIVLLVLSLKTMETSRQAFWDLQAKTAVFGKPAPVAGFAPVMAQPATAPAQPVPAQDLPPIPPQA